MAKEEEKSWDDLKNVYPEGSEEWKILEYSRASHDRGRVPPMLLMAFKILMGITTVMATVSLIGYLTH